MFAKILAIAVTSIAAVQACTNAGQYATNPVSAPSKNSWPTIGQPYIIKWDNTGPNQGPTLTLSLYSGCPNNCKEITDIAGGIKNTGSYTWTPSSNLQANDGYGILFINETPCMTSWTYFGLNAAGTVNTQQSSAAAPAAPVSAASSAAPAVPVRTTTTILMETSTVFYNPATVKSSAGGKTVTTTMMDTTTIYYDPATVKSSGAGKTVTTTVMDTTTMYYNPATVASSAASVKPGMSVITLTTTVTDLIMLPASTAKAIKAREADSSTAMTTTTPSSTAAAAAATTSTSSKSQGVSLARTQALGMAALGAVIAMFTAAALF